MVKVTPHENIVPCQDRWVKGNPYHDLIYNYFHARRLIRAASQYFHLKKGSAQFSGYVVDKAEGEVTINLWQDGEIVRTFSQQDVGYVAVLHVHLVDGFDQAVGYDLFRQLAA